MKNYLAADEFRATRFHRAENPLREQTWRDKKERDREIKRRAESAKYFARVCEISVNGHARARARAARIPQLIVASVSILSRVRECWDRAARDNVHNFQAAVCAYVCKHFRLLVAAAAAVLVRSAIGFCFRSVSGFEY